MIHKPGKTGCESYTPMRSTGYIMAEELLVRERKSFFITKTDKESNPYIVKKQLRCSISGCFDKYNICCKACDIKKCRYKCNYMDKEECEYQLPE